ncbi:MAG: GumC family protein [Candidatus Binatia bacterium]
MNGIIPPSAQLPALPSGAEAEYTDAGQTERVHLRDYWKILVKRRRQVGLMFLACLIVGTYVTLTATNLYTAKSTLKIESQTPSVTGVTEIMRVELGGPYDYYQTQFKLLESRNLASAVITELSLESDNSFAGATVISSNFVFRFKSWIFGNLRWIVSFFVPAKNPATAQPAQTESKNKSAAKRVEFLDDGLGVAPDLINRYVSFLSIQPVKNTRLVEVEFTTPDPVLSQTLANAHARGYIRLLLKSRFELTREAREYLDVKNLELRAKLERSEQALNEFRQRYGVVSMDKGENIVVERLVELNRQLTTARAQRIEAESLNHAVKNKSLQNLSQVVTQGLIPMLRASLQTLEAERIKLATIFKPEHPRHIEINQQIAEAKRSLNSEIRSVVRGIEETFVAARAKEEALQAEAGKQQQRALDLKQVGVRYAVLEEEVKVNRALYEGVLRRLNETQLSSDSAVSNVQVTQRAEKPLMPSSPDVALNIALTIFAGLFLGAGLAFLMEYLDFTVGTPQQVWYSLTLNTLGVVPNFNALNRRANGALTGRPLLEHLTTRLRSPLPALASASNELALTYHPLSVVAESYRSIRTSILFHQTDKPLQTILFTSPAPGDGKTVTTLNLSIAFAQDGYRVLVIDGDMRRGCCHKSLGVTNRLGLSNVLLGQSSVGQALQTTSTRGLSLLPRGVCPPNPTELLGHGSMRDLLASVREQFDFVLIDSPPVVAVSDTAVLATLCDGVVLVLNSKRSTMASARQALERLLSVRARVLGSILNSIDLDNPDYSYYRSYYGPNYGDYEVNEGVGSHEGNWKSNGAVEPSPLASMNGADSDSREFVQQIILELTDAAGPMAPLIVRNSIENLGESGDTFPRHRLRELVDDLCQEILDDNLRKHFRNRMAQTFRLNRSD